MPIINPSAGSYPSVEDINSLVRVHVNDTFAGMTGTVGEGRVYTDDWTPNLTILNAALQDLQDDLEDLGLPRTREVTFILNGILPINGPMGLGIPDPTIQPYLSFAGYWDGSVLHDQPTLPFDLLTPIKIGQRVSGSNTVFSPLPNRVDGLVSVYQNYLLGWWDWISDSIYFNGSQNTMDIELRYTGGVPKIPTNLNPDLFETTLIPFLDSLQALAYRCAYIFCSPRLPKGGADELQANYEVRVSKIANRWIKIAQRTPVVRCGFGYEGGPGASGEGW